MLQTKRFQRSRTWINRMIGLGLVGLFLSACGHNPEDIVNYDIVDRKSVHTEIDGKPYEVSYLTNGDPEGIRVIFVHGTPGKAAEQRVYLYNVPEGVEFISVDRPGFGHTKPRKAATSLDAQAAAILPLLEERNGVKPILIGHSLGGAVVANIAANYPDKVGAIVQLASALDPELESVLWVQHVGDFPLVSWALPSFLKNTNKELIHYEKELRLLQPKLADIRHPVSVIHSTDDSYVPYANVDYMQQHFENSEDLQVITLEGRDHVVPWTAGGTVMNEVKRLLANLKSGSYQANNKTIDHAEYGENSDKNSGRNGE